MSYDDLDLSFEHKEKLVQQAKELADNWLAWLNERNAV